MTVFDIHYSLALNKERKIYIKDPVQVFVPPNIAKQMNEYVAPARCSCFPFGTPFSRSRFVNRLSDLLFAASRYASLVDGKPERPWKKLPAQEESVGGEDNMEKPEANGSKQ